MCFFCLCFSFLFFCFLFLTSIAARFLVTFLVTFLNKNLFKPSREGGGSEELGAGGGREDCAWRPIFSHFSLFFHFFFVNV